MTRFEDPHHQAWVASFFDENHLNNATSPDLVASSAQMRFMVSLEPHERYYPCTQQVYNEIMARIKSPILGEMYNQAWLKTYRLVQDKIEDEEFKPFLIDLLNIKYQHETANYNIIPSRVAKRLYKLFVVTTQIEDPLVEEKAALNHQAADLYHSQAFIDAVNRAPGHDGESNICGETIDEHRKWIDTTKLRRIIQASVQPFGPDTGTKPQSTAEWDELFARPITGNGWPELEKLLLTPRTDLLGYWVPRHILYLPDKAGEFVFDLAAVKLLIRLGHRVIMAVKGSAYFDRIYLGDAVGDPVLKKMCEGAEIITNLRLTQNELASYLRNDRPFKIITDSTMEDLNLLRTSITFARVFKEVDGVIAKGLVNRDILLNTPFDFTQDIFCLSPEPDGALNVMFKPRCPKVSKFSTADLEEKADEIIATMSEAKEKGMTVMFYSGIVGSIPGETDTAIQVMTTFIDDLQKQQAGIFVINPSKFFERGMDADDLMFMWEIVQRSGYIDVWRFQTSQDIEKSFALMGKKVPANWVGKDSTFSTGCTKERAIAADVQKKNPEMQLIGPDQEKFSRRSEYGIGLFHDTRLSEIYER